MQDAITNVINKSDVQGLYLDTTSMSSLEGYFASGELRVKAAATISANASGIIRDLSGTITGINSPPASAQSPSGRNAALPQTRASPRSCVALSNDSGSPP